METITNGPIGRGVFNPFALFTVRGNRSRNRRSHHDSMTWFTNALPLLIGHGAWKQIAQHGYDLAPLRRPRFTEHLQNERLACAVGQTLASDVFRSRICLDCDGARYAFPPVLELSGCQIALRDVFKHSNASLDIVNGPPIAPKTDAIHFKCHVIMAFYVHYIATAEFRSYAVPDAPWPPLSTAVAGSAFICACLDVGVPLFTIVIIASNAARNPLASAGHGLELLVGELEPSSLARAMRSSVVCAFLSFSCSSGFFRSSKFTSSLFSGRLTFLNMVRASAGFCLVAVRRGRGFEGLRRLSIFGFPAYPAQGGSRTSPLLGFVTVAYPLPRKM